MAWPTSTKETKRNSTKIESISYRFFSNDIKNFPREKKKLFSIIESIEKLLYKKKIKKQKKSGLTLAQKIKIYYDEPSFPYGMPIVIETNGWIN